MSLSKSKKKFISGELPLPHEIASRIEQAIRHNHIRPGEFLPPERILAKRFRVSRMTIRQAINLLTQRGLLDRSSTRRPFVKALPSQPFHNHAQHIGVITGVSWKEIISNQGDERGAIIQSVCQVISESRYHLVFHNIAPFRIPWNYSLNPDYYAGIIYLPLGSSASDEVAEQIEQVNLPIVSIGNDYQLKRKDVHRVLLHDYHGIVLATQHLLDLGHKKIIHLTYREKLPFVESRIQAYLETMKQHQLFPRVYRVASIREAYWGSPSTTYFQELDKIWEDRFSGVVCVNDRLAVLFMQWCRYRNLSIPQDISVVGFDNFSEAEETKLTTVSYMSRELGLRGAQLLLHILETQPNQQIYQEWVIPSLVIRTTTAPQNSMI